MAEKKQQRRKGLKEVDEQLKAARALQQVLAAAGIPSTPDQLKKVQAGLAAVQRQVTEETQDMDLDPAPKKRVSAVVQACGGNRDLATSLTRLKSVLKAVAPADKDLDKLAHALHELATSETKATVTGRIDGESVVTCKEDLKEVLSTAYSVYEMMQAEPIVEFKALIAKFNTDIHTASVRMDTAAGVTKADMLALPPFTKVNEDELFCKAVLDLLGQTNTTAVVSTAEAEQEDVDLTVFDIATNRRDKHNIKTTVSAGVHVKDKQVGLIIVMFEIPAGWKVNNTAGLALTSVSTDTREGTTVATFKHQACDRTETDITAKAFTVTNEALTGIKFHVVMTTGMPDVFFSIREDEYVPFLQQALNTTIPPISGGMNPMPNERGVMEGVTSNKTSFGCSVTVRPLPSQPSVISPDAVAFYAIRDTETDTDGQYNRKRVTVAFVSVAASVDPTMLDVPHLIVGVPATGALVHSTQTTGTSVIPSMYIAPVMTTNADPGTVPSSASSSTAMQRTIYTASKARVVGLKDGAYASEETKDYIVLCPSATVPEDYRICHMYQSYTHLAGDHQTGSIPHTLTHPVVYLGKGRRPDVMPGIRKGETFIQNFKCLLKKTEELYEASVGMRQKQFGRATRSTISQGEYDSGFLEAVTSVMTYRLLPSCANNGTTAGESELYAISASTIDAARWFPLAQFWQPTVTWETRVPALSTHAVISALLDQYEGKTDLYTDPVASIPQAPSGKRAADTAPSSAAQPASRPRRSAQTAPAAVVVDTAPTADHLASAFNLCKTIAAYEPKVSVQTVVDAFSAFGTENYGRLIKLVVRKEDMERYRGAVYNMRRYCMVPRSLAPRIGDVRGFSANPAMSSFWRNCRAGVVKKLDTDKAKAAKAAGKTKTTITVRAPAPAPAPAPAAAETEDVVDLSDMEVDETTEDPVSKQELVSIVDLVGEMWNIASEAGLEYDTILAAFFSDDMVIGLQDTFPSLTKDTDTIMPKFNIVKRYLEHGPDKSSKPSFDPNHELGYTRESGSFLRDLEERYLQIMRREDEAQLEVDAPSARPQPPQPVQHAPPAFVPTPMPQQDAL